MSRYNDDYDGDSFPNASELYEANYERALKGKRGQKFLRELREALLALPEHRLIEGALCTVHATAEAEAEEAEWTRNPPPAGWLQRSRDAEALRDAIDGQGEGVCAIGAWLWHRKVREGVSPDEAFAALPRLLGTDHDLTETADAARAAGAAWTLAYNLSYMNDETFGGKGPEARHAAFIEWIDKQLEASAA